MVILGQENFLDKQNKNSVLTESHSLKNIYIHPNYNPRALYIDDIALLEVQSDIKFNEVRLPICLPQTSLEEYSGDIGVVLGEPLNSCMNIYFSLFDNFVSNGIKTIFDFKRMG